MFAMRRQKPLSFIMPRTRFWSPCSKADPSFRYRTVLPVPIPGLDPAISQSTRNKNNPCRVQVERGLQ